MSEKMPIVPHGLPGPLPAGETILWQGAPSSKLLARRVYHLPMIGLYFIALLVWREAIALSGGGTLVDALKAGGAALGLAMVTLGLLLALARLVARSTVYTITSRRLVIHCGIALSVTLNLPYRLIDAAELRDHRDGSGDISLTLRKGERISYLMFWPHVRPWHLNRVRPALRQIENASQVAQCLARALAADAAQPAPTVPQSVRAADSVSAAVAPA